MNCNSNNKLVMTFNGFKADATGHHTTQFILENVALCIKRCYINVVAFFVRWNYFTYINCVYAKAQLYALQRLKPYSAG
jgi:hypothetical protein